MRDELVPGERALRAGAKGDLVKQEAPENVIIAMGFGTSEIAVKMNRSVRTVERHRGNMRKKRGLRNAYELNRFAATFVEKERT